MTTDGEEKSGNETDGTTKSKAGRGKATDDKTTSGGESEGEKQKDALVKAR
jgi:hypothetical protein